MPEIGRPPGFEIESETRIRVQPFSKVFTLGYLLASLGWPWLFARYIKTDQDRRAAIYVSIFSGVIGMIWTFGTNWRASRYTELLIDSEGFELCSKRPGKAIAYRWDQVEGLELLRGYKAGIPDVLHIVVHGLNREESKKILFPNVFVDTPMAEIQRLLEERLKKFRLERGLQGQTTATTDP